MDNWVIGIDLGEDDGIHEAKQCDEWTERKGGLAALHTERLDQEGVEEAGAPQIEEERG